MIVIGVNEHLIIFLGLVFAKLQPLIPRRMSLLYCQFETLFYSTSKMTPLVLILVAARRFVLDSPVLRSKSLPIWGFWPMVVLWSEILEEVVESKFSYLRMDSQVTLLFSFRLRKYPLEIK